MNTFKFFVIYFFAMLRTNLRAAMALRGNFLMGASMMAVNNAFFLVNWIIFFEYFDEVAGWRLDDMFVLIGIISVGFGLCVFWLGGSRELSRLIENGTLDTWLVQPKPVVSSALASKADASGLGDIVSGLAFLAYAGVFSDPMQALLVIGVGLASAMVMLGGSILAHSLAFWLGDTYQLSRNVQEFLILFGFYPGSIHKPWAKVFLYVVLPAGLFGWMPAALLQAFNWADFGILMAGSFAYLAMAIWVFGRGLRRYSSGSRFSMVA